MADVDEVSNQEQEMTDDIASSAKSPSKSAKPTKKSSEEGKVSPVKSVKSSPSKSPKKTTKVEEEKDEKPSLKKTKKVDSEDEEEERSSPAKSPKKTKKVESEEEDDDDADEEVEEKKGVYDMPLVVEGKRKRESTSFLKVEERIGAKHKAPTVAGSGTALEDIPFVAHQIEAEKKVADLRPLYRICYGTIGKIHVLRKELKKFNGFSFSKTSDEYKRKHASVSKYTRAELSHIRRILGMAASKTKDDEVQVIMDFLLKPHDEGKSVPKKTKKGKKAKTPTKANKKEATSKKKTSSNETVDTESDEDDKSNGSGEDEKTPKKTPKKRKAVDQNAKTPSKKAKKAESDEKDEEKGDDHSVTSSSDSSEKNEEKDKIVLTPSDMEIKVKISELLKTFDLTSVSMKQMVLAVCEAFPEHPQLNERTPSIKAFIKDAIKEDE